jgi:hypothetical protein
MAGIEMWRGTGTLVVRSGEEECSLYFIDGRVYHAVGPGGAEGQAAVDIAAAWTEFEHSFDRESRRPTVETIGEEEPGAGGAADIDWRRRDAESLRQRAVYVFAFLIIAGLLMIWLFSQRT